MTRIMLMTGLVWRTTRGAIEKRSIRTRLVLIVRLLLIAAIWLQPLAPLSTAVRAVSSPPLIEANVAQLLATQEGIALRFDAPKYELSGCATLTLAAPEHNADPGMAESVSAGVYSQTGDDHEPLLLQETGNNSGRFAMAEGCLPFSDKGPVPNDGVLQSAPGEVVIAYATKADNQTALAVDTALIAGGSATGVVTLQIDPTILPNELSSTPSVPGEADFPVAKVVDPSGASALFGEDQVIYRPANEEDLNGFLARRNGRVLNKLSIPSNDKAGDPITKDGGPGAVDEFYLIRIDLSDYDASDFVYWLETLDLQGQFTYSSEGAVRLIAMLAEEQLAGTIVLPNALLQYDAVPASNEGIHGDWFTRNWFRSSNAVEARIGAAQALTLLDVADFRRPVGMAIVDGGFGVAAPSGAPGSIDNPDFGSGALQCDVDAVGGRGCGPGRAAGPNPLLCSGGSTCNWHGLQMASIAGAGFNNGFGAAGIGSHAAALMFFKVGLPYVAPVAGAITEATDRGAQVVNISSSMDCRPLVVDLCDTGGNILAIIALGFLCAAVTSVLAPLSVTCALLPVLLGLPPMVSGLQAALARAERRGVVVVAAAGNDGGNVDAVRRIPCVLGTVVCVGALDVVSGNLAPAAMDPSNFNSGFGASVDIWAPGAGVEATPDRDSSNRVVAVGGTSPATAFISGVVALIRALNPALGAPGTRNLLLISGCRSGQQARTMAAPCIVGHPTVDSAPGGYVDVLETVKRAGQSATPASVPTNLLRCTGGWDELVAANDTRATAQTLTFSGASPVITFGSRDLSIHALPSDEDWYRFTIPAALAGGAGSADVTVDLSFAAPGGTLGMQIFGPDPFAPAIATLTPTSSGHATFRRVLTTDIAFFVRITAADPVVPNDTCYSDTLTVQVHGAGAAGDRYEVNNRVGEATAFGASAWSHLPHAGTTFLSEEVWRLQLDNLSLHSSSDGDFFQVTLPNPEDPAQGGQPGLVECAEGETGGGFVTTATATTLRVRIVPQGTASVAEPIQIYQGGAPSPALSSGRGLSRTIRCPHTSLGGEQLVFSFGERTGRDRSQVVNYSLELIYAVPTGYQIPTWFNGQLQGGRGFFMPCPDGQPGFPVCGEEQAIFSGQHPYVLPPICLADGCGEFAFFRWAGGDLALQFTSEASLSFRLLDSSQAMIAEALPFAALAAVEQETRIKNSQQLEVPDLAAGWYALEVEGPEAEYELTFAPVAGVEGQRLFLPRLQN